MSPHEDLVTVIAACVVVAAIVGYLFHRLVLDVRDWFRWLRLPNILHGLRRDLGPDWADDWQREPVTDYDADQLIAGWRDDSPGRDWDSSRTPAPAAGGHHLGAPFERTITGDIWDQWWEGLDGLNRECLLVTAWVGRETAAWAELKAETRELCGVAA